MSTPTLEQIAKLPKWAQKHITALERERFISVRALNEYCDSQTESPFRYWDFICTGEGNERSNQEIKTRFIQTNKIEVHWAGLELTVLIRPDVKEIDIQWCAGEGQGRITEIAFIPKSFCSAVLKTKENMR